MSRSFLTPILLPADPTTALMAATKQYVDSKAGGGSVDEVSISATDPGATYELWVDTSTADLTDPNVARWNSAWGIIGVGSFTFPDGTALTVGAAFTNPLTVTLVANRRYRVSFVMRAVNSTPNVSGNVVLYVDGVGGPERWFQVIGSNGYNLIDMEWLTGGTGVHSFAPYLGAGAGLYGYSANSHFYIEDVGPVTLGSQPTQPSSAWTNLTLLNGWANEASGIQPAQYRLVGDKVEVRGSITKSGTTGTNPFNLPVGCRPPALLRQSLGVMQTGIGGSYTVRADLTTGGDLSLADYSSGAVTNPTIYLNTIQFSVTA
jgi:hypothetical protein